MTTSCSETAITAAIGLQRSRYAAPKGEKGFDTKQWREPDEYADGNSSRNRVGSIPQSDQSGSMP